MRIAAAVLFASLVLHAENNIERGKHVLEQAVAALGGDKFLTMRDRTETGRAYSFYRERLTGLAIAKIYTKYYDHAVGDLNVKERQTFGKKEDSIVLFDGKGGYQLTYRGVKPIEQERYERYVTSTRRNILYILRARLHEPGLIVEYKGSDVFENLPVEKVDITDAEDNLVSVFFAQSTHLPVYQIYSHLDPKTKERIDEVTRFTKFREVNGVQCPFNMLRERNGEKIFEIFSDSIAVNSDLNESLFAIPAGSKLLETDEKRPLVPLPSKTKEELKREK